MAKKAAAPRFGALVKFRMELLKEPYWKGYEAKMRRVYWDSKKKRERTFIFFGEIPNQPGHCLLFTTEGKPHFFCHTHDFIELTDDET